MVKIKFNSEQSNIVRAWASGQNIAVSSVAGSGKTTLSLAFQKVTKSSILYVAFTNSAKNELLHRCPSINCKTTYSLGIRALYDNYGEHIQTDKSKYRLLVEDYFSKNLGVLYEAGLDAESYQATLFLEAILDVIKFALVNLMVGEDDWDVLYDLCIDAGVDLEQFDNLREFTFDCVYTCLKAGYRQFLDEGIIDYSEQIALPVLLQDVQFFQYSKIVVDEAQDLSPAQRAIVLASLTPNGQLAIIGDPHQSIFMFAGASFDSFGNFTQEANLTPLSMTYNFRCGTRIISAAQKFVPHIKAHDKAIDGLVSYEAPKLSELKGDFMVIGRFHSELIKFVIELIQNNQSFHYVGDGLISKLRGALCKFQEDPIKLLPASISRWESDRDKVSSRVKDLHQALLVLYAHLKPKTYKGFLRSIARLIKKSNTRASLKLSTVHASKGREAEYVWFLSLDRKLEGSAQQIEQEQHLNYVAFTRAKKVLYLGKHGKSNDC